MLDQSRDIQTVRNGFELVSRKHLINSTELAYSELKPLPHILRAIKVLSEGNEDIRELSSHAISIIQIVMNDIDVIREQAEKAGLIGENA